MVVIILSAAPESLRGELTLWLAEPSPGVFVGHVSARVRDELWSRVCEEIGRGRALMLYSARNEQRYDVRSWGHDREPVDVDGLVLLRERDRDAGDRGRRVPGADRQPTEGWSIAGRRRRFGNSAERQLGWH